MRSMFRLWVLIVAMVVAVVVAVVVVAALLLASVLYDSESCPIPDPDPLEEVDMSKYEEIPGYVPNIKSREATERARAIRHKYEDLFWRQPNVYGVGIGRLEDENGEGTGQVGFVITVTEKVDQNTLPPEDRIPDCLEGVPVQIIEGPNDAILLMGMESVEEESNGSA